MSDNYKLSQVIGYTVLQLSRIGGWNETPTAIMDTIGQAIGVVRRYQEDDPAGTYAVAALKLAMISRPDKAATK